MSKHKSLDTEPSDSMTVRLPIYLLTKLDAMAKERDINRSTLVRHLLKRAITSMDEAKTK